MIYVFEVLNLSIRLICIQHAKIKQKYGLLPIQLEKFNCTGNNCNLLFFELLFRKDGDFLVIENNRFEMRIVNL